MLEPYEGKLSCTVLRRERGSNPSDLADYSNIAENLNGTIIKIGPTSNNYINIFDIRKESIEENENGYLATKIGKLIVFFNLIFGELNEEEKAIIEEKIIEVYKNKNITFSDKTLYKKGKS